MTKKPDMLDRLQISVPCSIDWDQMVGSDRMRYCSECSRDVHDISRMTRNEAMALISSATGRLCVRLVRDQDGSTLTEEPFVRVHLAGRRVSPIATAVVTAIMGISGSAVAAPPAQVSEGASAYSDSVTGKARAQARSAVPTGTLEGTVFDANESLIVGAILALRNDATGEVRGATSSSAGTFSFRALEPGSFTLTIQAVGFSRQVIQEVVATSHVKQVAVSLRQETRVVTGGAISMPAPQPLRTLYNNSELIVLGRVGNTERLQREGSAVLTKTPLKISSTLKGQTRKSTVYVYNWTYGEDAAQQPFATGDDVLVFLKRRQDRQTSKVLDGYEVDYPRYGVKKLSAADLAIYVSRIKELNEIKQTDVDSPEIAEWLVRCVEEPATRWEGAYELASSAEDRPEQDDEEDADSEQPDGNAAEVPSAATASDEKKNPEEAQASDEEEESETLLIDMLTAHQKERLASALFSTVVLSERDRELIEIEMDFKEARLLTFLISQLHALETDPPELVETLVGDVAELMKDEEVTRLANEYSEKVSYGDAGDTAPQDSVEGSRSRVSPADATASRSSMLKKFLALVEKKLNPS